MELEELSSAGYLWHFEADPADAVDGLHETRILPSAVDRDDVPPGDPVVYQAEFIIKLSGRITLTYKRPWEDELEDQVSFRIQLPYTF